MTTQTIRPESLSTSDWQQIFAHSPTEGDDRPQEDETSAGTPQSFDDYDSAEIRQVVSGIAVAVLMTDSGERLDYLQSVNPALTEEHLDEIAWTVERWLNDQAREHIRTIARRTYDSKAELRDMLIHWTTDEELKRLVGLLMETSVPDKTLAVCYAMATAYDTAFAAFLVHENRVKNQTNFANLKQTPEEIAADLRFVNSS